MLDPLSLRPFTSIILLPLLLASFLRQCHHAVSAFGGGLQEGRQRNAFGGRIFMFNSYLDNLSPKQNSSKPFNKSPSMAFFQPWNETQSIPPRRTMEVLSEPLIDNSASSSMGSYVDHWSTQLNDETHPKIDFDEVDEKLDSIQSDLPKKTADTEAGTLSNVNFFSDENVEILPPLKLVTNEAEPSSSMGPYVDHWSTQLNDETYPIIDFDEVDEKLSSIESDLLKKMADTEAGTISNFNFFPDENVENLPPFKLVTNQADASLSMGSYDDPWSAQLNDETYPIIDFDEVDEKLSSIESDLLTKTADTEAGTISKVNFFPDENVENLPPFKLVTNEAEASSSMGSYDDPWSTQLHDETYPIIDFDEVDEKLSSIESDLLKKTADTEARTISNFNFFSGENVEILPQFKLVTNEAEDLAKKTSE